MVISEKGFKLRIAENISKGLAGCFSVSCDECPVNPRKCSSLGDDLRGPRGIPVTYLFQAYLDGKVVIVNSEWCVVEED